MIEQGKVVAVTEHDAGSEVKEVAAINSTFITVEDSFDFEESGGTLEKEDGTQLTYTSVDPETDTITLSAPLAAALAVGDKVYIVPRGRSKRAMVDLEDETEGIKAGIRSSDFDIFPTGIRSPDEQESVILDDSSGNWTIIDQDDEVPMRDLSLADPTTVPEYDPGPAASSPTPTTTPGPAAIIVEWPYIPQQVDIYLAFSDTAPKDATTLYDTNARSPYWIYKDHSGNPITPTQTPYVALWAAGAPAPSAWVAAATEEIPDAFQTLLAGVVIAQRLSGQEVSGAILRGGELDIPGALHALPNFLDITAQQLNAMAATFNDNLTILGQSNKLAGGLELGTGVSNPTSKVSVSAGAWTTGPIFAANLPASDIWGLTDSPDGVYWSVVYYDDALERTELRRKKKSDGTGIASVTLNTAISDVPSGGITRIGNSYYVLTTRTNDPTDVGSYWVDVYDATTHAKTNEWRVFGSQLKKPHIGVIDGEIVVAWMNNTPALRWRTYNATTGAQTRDITYGGVFTARKDVWYAGNHGVPGHIMVWVDGFSPSSISIDGAVRYTSEDFSVPETNWGMWWDGTRMTAITKSYVRQGSQHPGGSFDYTWSQVDSDPLGGGVAETMVAPLLTSSVVPRFQLPVITIPAPQDDGTTDGANTGAIYAAPAGGTLRRQNGGGANLNANNTGAAVGGELVEPNKTLTLDKIETAGTAAWNVTKATANGFAARASSAPGWFWSAKADGDGRKWVEVKGDGLEPRIKNLRHTIPALRRYRGTAQTIASASAGERIGFATLELAEQITTTGTTQTIIRKGWYRISTGIGWDHTIANAGTGLRRTYIRVNGVTARDKAVKANSMDVANNCLDISVMKYLNPGDTIEVFGAQTATVNVNTAVGTDVTYLEIEYLGE